MSKTNDIRPLIWQAGDGELFCSAQCAADKGHTNQDMEIYVYDGYPQKICHCGKELV